MLAFSSTLSKNMKVFSIWVVLVYWRLINIAKSLIHILNFFSLCLVCYSSHQGIFGNWNTVLLVSIFVQQKVDTIDTSKMNLSFLISNKWRLKSKINPHICTSFAKLTLQLLFLQNSLQDVWIVQNSPFMYFLLKTLIYPIHHIRILPLEYSFYFSFKRLPTSKKKSHNTNRYICNIRSPNSYISPSVFATCQSIIILFWVHRLWYLFL